MKHYPLLFLALFGLSNCQKDPAQPLLALPGEYFSASELVARPIRMYTQQGEVRNTALIENFIQREYIPTAFQRTNLAIGDSLLVLSIPAAGPATLFSNSLYPRRDAQAEVTAQTRDFFVLTRVDSTNQMVPQLPLPRCSMLVDQLKQALPAKRCYRLSPATGYAQLCRVRQAYAITIRDGQLFLPLMTYAVKSASAGESCRYAQTNEWNLFNPALRSQLQAGDTLVLQVNEVALLKKED